MNEKKIQLEKIIQHLKEIKTRLVQIRDKRELNKLMLKLKNGKS